MDIFGRNITKKNPRFRAIFSKGVHFIYEKCLKPRATNEDDARRERILNIILGGFIALILFFEGVLIYSSYGRGAGFAGESIVVFTSIVAIFGGLLVLSRLGHVRIAASSLIGVFFVTTALGSYKWGINLPSTLCMYMFIIAAATVIVSCRFGIWMTALISITLITLQWLSMQGVIHPSREWILQELDMIDSIDYVVFFCIIMFISWLSNNDTRRSLIRARKSEQALKEERDSLEIKVQKRTEELQRLQAEKVSQLYRFVEFGRLSAGIFHDLVNPLYALASTMREIDTSKDPRLAELPDIKEGLDRSIQASKKMERYIIILRKHMMVDDYKERFILNESIEDTLMLFNYKALKTGITVNFIAEEKITTYDSSLKFQQVVGNLVSNAIDACRGIAAPNKEISVQIHLRRVGDRGVITVRDEGCGIPSDLHEKIFDPFFTTKSRYQGMGLGLSTTKDIVERYFKGTIAVASAQGAGSTFTVSVPLHEYNDDDTSDTA